MERCAQRGFRKYGSFNGYNRCRRWKYKAAIGPCISPNNYEVGQDFFDTFIERSKDFEIYFSEGAKIKNIFSTYQNLRWTNFANWKLRVLSG